MFDWVLTWRYISMVLNTPLNTITNFFPDVSKLKLMTLEFFITIDFSYQYLPEAKEKFYFCKIHMKTPVPEYLFNKVTDLYLPTLLKERTRSRCFLMNFARYLRRLFYRTPPGYCFCSTEKYFSNKIVNNPLKKKNGYSL